MKLWILLFIFSTSALGCLNQLPLSEVRKALNLESGVGAIRCEDRTDEQCVCFDGIGWDEAKLVDEIVNGNPIYTVNSQSSCIDEDDCNAKMKELVCDEGFTAKFRLDNPQVFCERLDGYEQVKTGLKALVEDSSKRSAKESARREKEASRAAKRAKRDAAKEELKSIDWNSITTVAKLKQVLKAVVEKIEEDE